MQLRRAGFRVFAYDLDRDILSHVDESLEAPVAHADKLYLSGEFDLVVASGMTLVTMTFQRMVDHCGVMKAPLLMYCQTGANLGAVLIECGASGVVAEHLPFYNWEGESRVSVYRA